MLNFSPDHLDRHADVEAYGAAKARIFENQNARRLGRDQRRRSGGRSSWRGAAARAQRLFARTRARSIDGTVVDGRLDRRPRGATAIERLVPLDAIHLLGPHLVDDVMAAATVGAIAGVAPAAMTRGGRGVSRPRARDGAGRRHRRRALRQRLEGDQRRGGAARRSRASSRVWCAIIGGRFKGGDLAAAARAAGARARRRWSPSARPRPLRAARRSAGASPVHDAARHGGRGAHARSRSRSRRGVVLLAPACSSFDMFRDYAERGRVFKDGGRRGLGSGVGAGAVSA